MHKIYKYANIYILYKIGYNTLEYFSYKTSFIVILFSYKGLLFYKKNYICTKKFAVLLLYIIRILS